MATDGHYVLQSMKLKEKNNDHVSQVNDRITQYNIHHVGKVNEGTT